jgi:hypothetical protein
VSGESIIGVAIVTVIELPNELEKSAEANVLSLESPFAALAVSKLLKISFADYHVYHIRIFNI